MLLPVVVLLCFTMGLNVFVRETDFREPKSRSSSFPLKALGGMEFPRGVSGNTPATREAVSALRMTLKALAQSISWVHVPSG